MATTAEADRRTLNAVDPRRSHDIDLHVATRIRERRMMLGLTQPQLAELIGTTQQQACKYEAGINHITVGRLHQIAEVLGVEIGYFFDGMTGERAASPTLQHFLLLGLIRSFTAIPDKRHRAALCNLARRLAELSDGSAH